MNRIFELKKIMRVRMIVYVGYNVAALDVLHGNVINSMRAGVPRAAGLDS
jgi:hypothetical protein